MTIDRLIANTEALNIDEVITEGLENTAGELVKYQQFQMLMGFRADGERIGKYKNRYYAAKKYSMNPLAGLGYVDLRLEGYFQKGIFVDIRDYSRSVVFTSADEKANMLMEKYGENIFGLRDITAAEYSIMYLQPEALQLILKQIFK